jgi:hypothetical protein
MICRTILWKNPSTVQSSWVEAFAPRGKLQPAPIAEKTRTRRQLKTPTGSSRQLKTPTWCEPRLNGPPPVCPDAGGWRRLGKSGELFFFTAKGAAARDAPRRHVLARCR